MTGNKQLNEPVVITEIETYCYLIIRGKPTAVVSIQNRYASKAIKKIISYKLKAYFKKVNDDWGELWIYKDDYMFEVIKSLPDKPKTIYEHWILGKVFGYSEEAIKKFVSKLF